MKTTQTLYILPYLMYKDDLKKAIIDWFNNAIKYDTFFGFSDENKKCIGYDFRISRDVLKEVAEELSISTGLNVRYEPLYLGGPTHGLVIRPHDYTEPPREVLIHKFKEQ